MSQGNRTSILLVDDHDLVRKGLELSLERSADFQVVGVANDGRSAIKQAINLRPNIVLMDIGMPEMDGIEATWQIKNAMPEARVIMLTSHDSDADILASLGAGADGFCRKDVTVEQLNDAIKVVNRGEIWLESSIAQRVLGACDRPTALPASPFRSKQSMLVERQVQMMRLVEQSYEFENRPGNEFETFFPSKPIASKRALQRPNDSGVKAFADKYHIESVISEGGMGIVYKARHVDMDKVVAIKVLKDNLAMDRRVMRWFHQEAKTASSLNHPNIISVFDFGINEMGQPFLVMDYVDGINLDQVIMTHGALPLPRFLKIFGQVCDGLAMAHSRNIIHCDLKPSNIMLLNSENKEYVKIVDFGLSNLMPLTSTVQTQMTDRFEVAGSPLYMSPEQCLGQRMDVRSDIYSLGCVMYETITGHPVFDTESPFETFGSQLRESPKRFLSICPQWVIPNYLESIIFKTLDKAPKRRYQSVLELRQDLMSVMARRDELPV